MTENKLTFYPLKIKDQPFNVSLKEIITEFRSYILHKQACSNNFIATYLQDRPKPLNYPLNFNQFVKQLETFIDFTYGKPSKPITVGEISKLYAIYINLCTGATDSKLDK